MKYKNVIGSSLILIFVIIFGFMGKSTEMSILVVAGGIVLSFLNLDKIQKFKGGGFEAEMRQTIDEANATIEQLREVATTSSEAIFTDLMASNFFNGIGLNKKIELHEQLMKNLKDIGASHAQIKKANITWDKGISIIFHRGLRCAIAKSETPHNIPSNLDEKTKQVLSEFQNLMEYDKWFVPNSNELRNFIIKRNVMNKKVDEILKDYSYYEDKGLLRRHEVFVTL